MQKEKFISYKGAKEEEREMIPIFRVPVRRSKEEKEDKTPPQEKTYSSHEVENILRRFIHDLNSVGLFWSNDITISCNHDLREKGILVDIRQGRKVVHLIWNLPEN